jgi:hypothetical protein
MRSIKTDLQPEPKRADQVEVWSIDRLIPYAKNPRKDDSRRPTLHQRKKLNQTAGHASTLPSNRQRPRAHSVQQREFSVAMRD